MRPSSDIRDGVSGAMSGVSSAGAAGALAGEGGGSMKSARAAFIALRFAVLVAAIELSFLARPPRLTSTFASGLKYSQSVRRGRDLAGLLEQRV